MAEPPQEAGRTRPIEWLVAGASCIGALGVVLTGALWLTGVWTGPITARLDLLDRQMSQFQTRMELLPRSDQVAGIDGHAHALDGRMDAMETRLRNDEIDIATGKHDVSAIQESSARSLGASRK